LPRWQGGALPLLAMHVIYENVFAPIAAAHDMRHGTRISNPWCARHGWFFARFPPKVNTTTNDSMVSSLKA
jgi:hypothetical protein